MTYDRTLIVIRERSFLELLDLALVVVRDRPIVLLVAALAGIAPLAAVNIWLLSDVAFSRAYWVVLLLMEAPWATAPLTLVLGDLMFGVRPRPGRILKGLAVSLPKLVRHPALVPRVLALDGDRLFAGAVAVCVPERSGVARACRDLSVAQAIASALSRGFGGELFFRWLGQIALGLTFALCFQKGVSSLGSVLVGGELTWDQPGLSDFSGLLFQAARLDRDRVFRDRSLPLVHRPANPTGRLGDRAAAEDGRPALEERPQ